MKNFHKVRKKRELLFDDKELFILSGGAIVICVLIFILGVMVGQSLQEQSIASPIATDADISEDQRELTESEMSQSKTLLAENRPQEGSEIVPESEESRQRSYYQVLPDSDTYVEVDVTPAGRSEPGAKPEQTAQEKKTPKQVVKEETPIPPPAVTPASVPSQPNMATVPALPNVPKNPGDEIRMGRQSPGSSEVGTPPLSGMIYSVQVASSTSKEESERLQQKYGQRGYLAYIMTADLGERGVWYRVRVGNLQTRDEAKLLKKEILEKAPNLANDPFIIKVTE